MPDKNKLISQRHLGIITQRSLYWWRRLPSHAKNFYSLDDMIGDVVLHVFARRRKYRPDKAKESTWIYWVAENKCKSVCAHYATQQFLAAETVDLDGSSLLTRSVASRLDLHDRGRSRDAVERVIETGGDAVRDFLADVFGGHATRPSGHVAADLRKAAARCGATCRDFEVVLRFDVR